MSVATDGASGRRTGATGVLAVRVSVLITLLFGENCHRVKSPRGSKEAKETTTFNSKMQCSRTLSPVLLGAGILYNAHSQTTLKRGLSTFTTACSATSRR